MKRRQAFTLVELLIVVAILVILVVMIAGGVGLFFAKDPATGKSYYNTTGTGVYQCVKTYTVADGESTTSKRVDLRSSDGGSVETMACDDDFRGGIHNSASTYAQFEDGRWYNVSYIGFRKEGWHSFFPLVTSVSTADDPTVQEMENPITEVPAEVSEESFIP
jgi:prepilin-type N-terminal cleavage/methylation domain-containing protein